MPIRNASSPDLDFNQLIEERTRQFTGREWVFKAVRNWLSDHDGARFFLLTGGPGTGKTAIAARIAQMHLGQVKAESSFRLPRDFLAYFHFCQAGLDSTLSPLTFVQCFSQALANRYSVYRRALEQQGSQQFVINPVVAVGGDVAENAEVVGAKIRIEILGGDARPMFDQMVRRPLGALCKSDPGKPIVALVDSLDEAISFNPDNNIAQLMRLVEDFPAEVRFLVTCRANDERVFDVVGKPSLDLIADAPRRLDEIMPYAMSRLHAVPEPRRSIAAKRIAKQSKGNFLYAYHVLNELVPRGADVDDADTRALPDKLEDVYRMFLQRELALNQARWNDFFRPLIGAIAVARGEGMTKEQLIGLTGLAEDTATDVLTACWQYLVGDGGAASPYRIYHESFREFLLYDKKFTVFPAERHAAIARFFEDKCRANWGTCDDEYALRYTPFHWAEAATLSEVKRETRTKALIELVQNLKYQRRFDRRIGDIPALQEQLLRAVRAAALNDRGDMLPWLIKASQTYVAFQRDYLQGESVANLAQEGKLDQAEARLRLFSDIDEDWQIAARLIIAWIGVDRNLAAAEQLCSRVAKASLAAEPLLLLMDRVTAAFAPQADFTFEPGPAKPLEVVQEKEKALKMAQEMVKRVSGQDFNRELLLPMNPSLLEAGQGYAAEEDAPILVDIAREHGSEGIALLDRYIDAHAGYNYVVYRNRSLWFVMKAVLQRHGDQGWVKERLRRILVAALTGGGVDFREMMPLTALLLSESAKNRDSRQTAELWRSVALDAVGELKNIRGADDTWGSHKRRLTGMMESYELLFHDEAAANALKECIDNLPGGFAGFEAPAYLRLADALRARGLNAEGLVGDTIEKALQSAHHIQDYHFLARVTARCNTLKRWHETTLAGQDLAKVIRHLAAFPTDPDFAADHLVHEAYMYRNAGDPNLLPIANARQAETLEQLVEVFQRPAVEFLRLSPQYGLAQKLDDKTRVRVPDPGLPPLLACHFSARALADASLDEERASLLRMLVPVAVGNATALDTMLSYVLIANQPDDPELLEDIVTEAGPVAFAAVVAPTAQIGPDAVMPA